MESSRRIFTVIVCAAAGIMSTAAPAQQPQRERTVGAFLEFMAAKTEADCAKNRDTFEKVRAKASPREQVLFEANQEICACMQRAFPEVLSGLSPEERSRTISKPAEVMGIAGPAVTKCSSLALRSLFGGRLCPAYTRTMTRENLALDRYCNCMKADIDKYSDARAVETFKVLMDYFDALAKASREGAPPPARPASIEPLNETSLRCGQESRPK